MMMGNNGSFSSVTNFFQQCTAVFVYKELQKGKIVFNHIIVSTCRFSNNADLATLLGFGLIKRLRKRLIYNR